MIISGGKREKPQGRKGGGGGGRGENENGGFENFPGSQKGSSATSGP